MSAISRKVLSAFFLLSGVLLVATGCQKKEQFAAAPPPAATLAPTAEPVSVVPTAAPALPTAAPASSAAPAAAPASSAVASTEGEKPGIRVEVTELKRSPSALSLKFTIVNGSEKQMSFNYDFGDPTHSIKDFNSVGGVTLLDAAGKKKYMVVRDSDTACVCSQGVKDLPAGSRVNLWAKFPPPPEDVKRISIVIPHFSPMDDVPISQ
jgi:hypothetical protein